MVALSNPSNAIIGSTDERHGPPPSREQMCGLFDDVHSKLRKQSWTRNPRDNAKTDVIGLWTHLPF